MRTFKLTFCSLLFVVSTQAKDRMEVGLFCLPVQHIGLKLGAALMGSSPVHCAVDVQSNSGCHRVQSSDVEVFIVDMPCDQRVTPDSKTVPYKKASLPVMHFQVIKGCNVERLLEAASEYGDDSQAPLGARSEENGYGRGYKRPQGWGMPAYLPATSNTFIRWILAECGVKVEMPRGAKGWDTKPSFPGPLKY